MRLRLTNHHIPAISYQLLQFLNERWKNTHLHKLYPLLINSQTRLEPERAMWLRSLEELARIAIRLENSAHGSLGYGGGRKRLERLIISHTGRHLLKRHVHLGISFGVSGYEVSFTRF